MDMQRLRENIHRKIRDHSFLLEAEANADKEDILPTDRRDDSETGGAYCQRVSPDCPALEKKNRESAKDKGLSDAFRECPCGRDLRQCGQTPRAFSQEGSLQEQAEDRSCGR